MMLRGLGSGAMLSSSFVLQTRQRIQFKPKEVSFRRFFSSLFINQVFSNTKHGERERTLNGACTHAATVAACVSTARVPLRRRLYATATANDLKRGYIIEEQGKLYQVVSLAVSKKGRGSAHVQCELRQLDGERSKKAARRFRPEEKVELIQLQRTMLRYVGEIADEDAEDESGELLFETDDGDECVLAKRVAGGDLAVWLENQPPTVGKCMLSTHPDDEERIVDFKLPDQAHAVIVDTAASSKGDQRSPTFKPAVLDNGRTVSVPPHCKNGEEIVVNLPDESYVRKL